VASGTGSDKPIPALSNQISRPKLASPRRNPTKNSSSHAMSRWEMKPGKVRIEIDDGPTLNVKPGSMVSLPAGVETTWHVTRPYKDLYVIG